MVWSQSGQTLCSVLHFLFWFMNSRWSLTRSKEVWKWYPFRILWNLYFSHKWLHEPEMLLVNAHFKTFRGHKLHYVKPFDHKMFLECFLPIRPFLFYSLHYQRQSSSAAIMFSWTETAIWFSPEAGFPQALPHSNLLPICGPNNCIVESCPFWL